MDWKIGGGKKGNYKGQHRGSSGRGDNVRDVIKVKKFDEKKEWDASL